MSTVSSKQVEGIIVVAVVVVLTAWYGYQAFRLQVGVASVVSDVSVDGLSNPSLKTAAEIESNDQSRYGVPVPVPGADELGKEQLF